MSSTYTLGGVTLYVKDFRMGTANNYISFIEPLSTDPTTSEYNLKQVSTTINIKCYVRLTNDSAPTLILGSPAGPTWTGLYAMQLGDPVALVITDTTTGTTTFNVMVKSVTQNNVPEVYWIRDSTTGALVECNDVELSLEKAVSL